MIPIGTPEQPLSRRHHRIGPAAFYAAESLFKQASVVADVDMFDRLPSPHGLVRYGVAPDHPKIKTVTRAYDAIAAHARFRFYGNVEFGRHLALADLRAALSPGALRDRRADGPADGNSRRRSRGESSGDRVRGVVQRAPGLSRSSIRLVRRARRGRRRRQRRDRRRANSGRGRPTNSRQTDVAAYALEALGESRVREVYLLGRRGPAQAAFTNPR